MISIEEARKRIDKAVHRLPIAKVSLSKAIGCCLGEDIIASINVPDFRTSSMDGFAARNSDLEGDGPWRFPIQDIIIAGKPIDGSLKKGHAVKIMTGAPLIDGADTVIRVEDVDFDSDHVSVKKKPPVGSFVRPLGDDIVKGKKLFDADYILTPVDTGILASIGLTEVKVVPKPEIILISTGTEIVKPGDKLKAGQIYDSNSTVLKSLLANDGYTVSIHKRIKADNTDELCEVLKECLKDYNLVISSGGVSMGDYDLIPEAIEMLGGEVLFYKVKVKPGKPVFIASIKGSWFIGLPGNPVSVTAGYHLYVKQILCCLGGKDYHFKGSKAILQDDLRISGERFCLIGARIFETDNVITAVPSVRQQSGRLSSITGINGFIMTEGGNRTLKKGSEVYIEWLY